MIFRRTTGVPQFTDYLDYRDPYLRPDFQYRCAYCLTHERFFLDGEAGEVDHHRPLNPPAALGKDFSPLKSAYDNLYWSCSRCNLYKGNLWPTDEEYGRGERFVDPCAEDHDDHWETHPDGALTATTPTGQYTIKNIRLARPRLNRRRAELYAAQRKVLKIRQELERADLAPEHLRVLRAWLETVQEQISPPVFRDPPKSL